MGNINKETIKALFTYTDGLLIRNKRHRDTFKRPYKVTQIDKKLYYTHRLIWIYHYGEIPDGYEIDHINRDKHDNKIENLRLVTRKENMYNIKGAGVRQRGRKYEAYIQKDYTYYYLGLFGTKEEALEARNKAKKELH